jgi:hypothetical protein
MTPEVLKELTSLIATIGLFVVVAIAVYNLTKN